MELATVEILNKTIFVITQLIKLISNSCIIQIIKKGHERASSDFLAEPDEGGDAVGGLF